MRLILSLARVKLDDESQMVIIPLLIAWILGFVGIYLIERLIARFAIKEKKMIWLLGSVKHYAVRSLILDNGIVPYFHSSEEMPHVNLIWESKVSHPTVD